MQKIFSTILAVVFLGLVVLFTYKEMSKPKILTAPLHENITQEQENIPGKTFRGNKSNGEKHLSKEEVTQLIKDYIINNPEVLVESLEGLHNKKSSENAQKSTEYLKENKEKIESEDSPPVLGNVDGDITIVVFYDYNCSFCKKASEHENEILQADRGVKIILRPIPILDESSMYAAKVALAVQKINNESFQAIHHELMKLKIINEEQVKVILKKFDIDYAVVENEINSYGIKQLIIKNFDFAKEIGIKGTPSYVINGKFIPGLIPLDKFKNIIMQIRASSEDKEPNKE